MTSRDLVLLLFATLLVAPAGAGQAPLPRVASRVIDATRLFSDLRALSADDMQGREFGTAGGRKARDYIASAFKDAGLTSFAGESYLESFTAAGRSGANVVGYLPGTNHPDRFIVVSAHYDHIGVRDGQVFNGADDNGSGAAALVTMARYFAARPPRNTLVFAAFDGEEEDLLGSKAFVAHPPVPTGAMIVDINADMIGREPDDRLFVVGLRQEPFLEPYVERVRARAAIHLIAGHDAPGPQGQEDWTRDSDQFSFLEAGIPALYLGVEDYEQQHRATDDFETITYPFYVHAVETIIDLVHECDAFADEIAAKRGR